MNNAFLVLLVLFSLSAHAEEGGRSPLKDGTYVTAAARCIEDLPDGNRLELEVGREFNARGGHYTYTGRTSLEFHDIKMAPEFAIRFKSREILTRAAHPSFLWKGQTLDVKLFFGSGVSATIVVLPHAGRREQVFGDCDVTDFSRFHRLADPNGELDHNPNDAH